MPVVRRFEFDVSFDAPGKAWPKAHAEPEPPPPPPEPEPEPEPPPPPPEPTFSQAELDAAYARGEAEGKQTGEFTAMERIERRLADTIERLTHVLQDSVEAQRQGRVGIERQAVELSMLALRKLFPVLLQRAEGQELEAVFSEVFDQAIEEPRIVVRAAPGMIEALEERLRALAARSGFEGKLSLIGDPRLAETDCRVEWSEGGVERDPHRSLKAIEAAVAKAVAAFDRQSGASAPDATEARALEENV